MAESPPRESFARAPVVAARRRKTRRRRFGDEGADELERGIVVGWTPLKDVCPLFLRCRAEFWNWFNRGYGTRWWELRSGTSSIAQCVQQRTWQQYPQQHEQSNREPQQHATDA